MKHLLLFLFLIPSLLWAQEDQKYLTGAVPEENGKVVFNKEINLPSLSKDQIYDTLLTWAEGYFEKEGARIVYSDKAQGDIAAVGEKYLVFSSTALSLDRTNMQYRVTIECENHSCSIKISGMRYEYNVSYQREPEKYIAEEWITDKYALNKNKNKLNRGNGKFRRETIDFVDGLFQSATAAFGIVQSPVATAQTGQAGQKQVTASVIQQAPISNNTDVCQGLTAFEADKIPSTLLQMLSESNMQVSPAGNESLTERYASWKELGKMFGKNIASISINPESDVYKAIKDNDIYTITFSKKDNPETWFMIQCSKQGESTEGARKIVIGEILGIWIR